MEPSSRLHRVQRGTRLAYRDLYVLFRIGSESAPDDRTAQQHVGESQLRCLAAPIMGVRVHPSTLCSHFITANWHVRLCGHLWFGSKLSYSHSQGV